MKVPPSVDRVLPLALGAVAIGGVAVAVVPQHAGTVLRLLAATIAAAAVLVVVVTAIGAHLDPGADRRPPSPLDRPRPDRVRPMEPPGLSRARRALAQEVARGRGDLADPAAVAAAADRILDQQGSPP